MPSGVLWAPCNIDISQPGGFAKSPFQYDSSFFSWGNIDGHNPTSPSSFLPWDWGGSNSESPWYEGQVYGDTPGCSLESDIAVGPDYDAARAILGSVWRLPSSSEFQELIENCDFIDADDNIIAVGTSDKRVTVNGIVGLRLKSKINGNVIFFPASGYGQGTSWRNRSASGYYWSSSWVNDHTARALVFIPSGVSTKDARNRFLGFAVRPVMTI